MRGWIAFIVLAGIVLAVAGVACSSNKTTGGTKTATATSTVPAASTSVETTTPFEKVVQVGQSQTVEGLQLTIGGIGLASPSDLFNGQELVDFQREHPGTQTVVVVEFQAFNTAATTSSLPFYTSTKGLINDEQVDIDITLSEVQIEVLSGARVDMRAVFLTSRYAPRDVRSVRFVLEKTYSSALPESETTYDFTVPVP